jgi:hypothetical protein
MPNKLSTSILKAYGNKTGYTEGLNLGLYDSTELSYQGGNPDRGDTKSAFVSQLYENNENTVKATTTVHKAPWSIANKYALFAYNGFHGNSLNILKNNYADKLHNYF